MTSTCIMWRSFCVFIIYHCLILQSTINVAHGSAFSNQTSLYNRNKEESLEAIQEVLDNDERDTSNTHNKQQEYLEDFQHNSFWGRLYVDGMPGQNGIQYYKAQFGSYPPLDRVKMVVPGDSLQYCDSQETKPRQQSFGKDTVLIVHRGSCPFAEKAKRAQDEGAGGLVVINSEEGNLHPSIGQDIKYDDVHISVVMISMHHGKRLLDSFVKTEKPIWGKYVPMRCSLDETTYCVPLESQDETYITQFFDKYFEGNIVFNNKTSDYEELLSTKYIQAQFGSNIMSNETFDVIDGSSYTNLNFCDETEQSPMFVDKAIIVYRGDCSFAQKAQNIAAVGAKVMILVNDDMDEFAMGVENDYLGSTIRVIAVTIAKGNGDRIINLLQKSEGSSSVQKMSMTLNPSFSQ